MLFFMMTGKIFFAILFYKIFKGLGWYLHMHIITYAFNYCVVTQLEMILKGKNLNNYQGYNRGGSTRIVAYSRRSGRFE